MKTCSKCKQNKPFADFGKKQSNKDNYQYECKICRKHYRQSAKGKAAKKRYQQSEKGKNVYKRFDIRNPEYHKATHAVNNAIRDGKLPRPDTLFCHYCPKLAQQYHHWHGYEKEHQLDVVPACKKCHDIKHRKIA